MDGRVRGGISQKILVLQSVLTWFPKKTDKNIDLIVKV